MQPFISIPATSFLKLIGEIAALGKSQLSVDGFGPRIEVAGSVDFAAQNFPNGFYIERIDFRGAISMNNCLFGKKVQFKDCTFDQPLDFRGATFANGVTFEQCSFGAPGVKLTNAGVNLNGSDIIGDVVFFKTTVYGCISAKRLELAGDFTFTACTIDGDSSELAATVDLSNSQIVGTVSFERDSALSQHSPSEAVANANGRAANRDPFLRRSIFVDRTGSASVALPNARTIYVDLSYARFFGKVDLANLECSGLTSKVGYFACRPDEPVHWPDEGEGFGGAQIQGDLVLSGGKFKLVHLNGIYVSHTILLLDGQSGQIEIGDGLIGDTEVHVAGSDIGNFIMGGWNCSHFIKLHATRIRGEGNQWALRGIQIKSSEIDGDLCFFPGRAISLKLQGYLSALTEATSRPDFLILDKDGKLTNSDTDASLRAFINRWQRRLIVRGDINIENCGIEGEVNLTGVQVEGDQSAGSRIKIFDTKIVGALKFSSPVSYLTNLDRRTDPYEDSVLLLLARFAALHDALMPNPQNRVFKGASCSAIETRELDASDIDLTGLRIARPEDNDLDDAAGRRVQLHYTKIRGKIATFDRLNTKAVQLAFEETVKALPPPDPRDAMKDQNHEVQATVDPFPQRVNRDRELLSSCFGDQTINSFDKIRDQARNLESVNASAEIPGALDLQHAKVDELYVSDTSFQELAADCKPADNGIVLDYADIGRLYVARGPARPASEHNRFPIPLSLLDLSVKSWFLEDRESQSHNFIERETTIADPYLDLLDNDRVFRASAYLEIEKVLRNRGLEEEANRVFIAGHYRDERIGFEGEEYSDKNIKKESRTKKIARRWSIWRPGDGRYRPRMLIPAFRLRRPRREYLGFALCLIWFLFFGFLVYFAATAALANDLGRIVDMLVYLMVLLALAFGVMRHAMRLFFDQLFWSLLDYGTSPHRLIRVVIILATFSFLFISGERENFEPTLAAEIADAQKTMLASGKDNSKEPAPHQDQERKWDEHKIPKEEYWPLGERVWMTLRYHMPLVSAVLSEEWQPADRPLAVSGFESTPSWWPFKLRSRDWFSIMLWANWILWPLFLPYFIRGLIRKYE